MSPEELGKKVVKFAQERFGAMPIKGDVWAYAQLKELPLMYKIQTEDGKEIYVDDHGKEVKVPEGHFFISTKNPKAKEKDWGVWK